MIDLMDIEDLVPEEIAGWCGILAPLIAYILIGISILIHPWFSWADHALSDLGAVETSYNNVFNFALMATGMIAIVFAFGIFRLAEDYMGILGVSLFIISLVLLIMIGIFPSGTPPHFYISVSFFAVGAAGLALIAVDQLIDMDEPVWGIFILSSLGLNGIAVWLVYSIPYEGLGNAIPEFIGTIPVMLFMFVYGARLIFE
ncbi:MAG: DUF998 domain-containing protein [Thermoplasmatota archaeon]